MESRQNKVNKVDKVDEKWANAFGAYYHKRDNKEAKIVRCPKTKLYYVKQCVLEIIGNTRNTKWVYSYINAKEYL